MTPSRLAFALLLAACGAASSDEPGGDVRHGGVEAIRAALPDDFSGTVTVVADEAVYGLSTRSALDEGQRLDRAVWPWASLTKLVTSVLVLQEVEAGTLGLSDPLGQHLTSLEGGAAAVTIEQALRHASGLPNPEDQPDNGSGWGAFYEADAPDLAFCGGEPTPEPDAFSYNNCDYALLGAVLEEVTGEDYADLVRTRIAEPLGLDSVRLIGTDESGVVRGSEGGEPTGGTFRRASLGAAGALVGTAEDAARFVSALSGDGLLSAASRTALFDADPQAGYAALGVWAYEAQPPGCDAPLSLAERQGDVRGIKVLTLLDRRTGTSVAAFSDRAETDWGWVWSGQGIAAKLVAAAFCADTTGNGL